VVDGRPVVVVARGAHRLEGREKELKVAEDDGAALDREETATRWRTSRLGRAAEANILVLSAGS
jgi:hypothetical protein